MITIIHGDNTAASRKYFLDEKQKQPDAQTLDGEKVTLTDLAQIFEGGELFSDTKAVFIEQFFTKRKKSQERDALTASLQKYATENFLFLWEGKELEKSILNLFKTANIKVFKLPQTLFLFLDSIKPDNGKQLISLFHQSLETTEVEMIFFMIVRQIRLLLASSRVILERSVNEAIESSTGDPIGRSAMQNFLQDDIDELKRLAPWQKSKLENQARQFSAEQLIDLYSKLFQIEVNQKTGNLSSSLSSSIDFLLLEI